MGGLKPVTISNSAFNFCKYTMAIILWFSVILKSELLLAIAFIVLIISAIAKVEKSPLVLFYNNTFDKIFKYKEIIIEENAICFAHTVGAVFSGVALILIQFLSPVSGWIFSRDISSYEKYSFIWVLWCS